jgi:ribosome biogenesis GTPase
VTNSLSSPENILELWGWSSAWEQKRNDEHAQTGVALAPARILAEQRDYMEVITSQGAARAEIKGRLRKHSKVQPAVGDWVLLDASGLIQAVLPRTTCLKRKAAGEGTQIQILAANVDWVFVTTSLNADFNPRKIERFLVAARDSGAKVALIFTKSDLGALNAADAESLLEERLGEIEIVTTSVQNGDGLSDLRRLIGPSETAVFLGSSGVGKSSLVNALLNSDIQLIGEARIDDDKGRHTTTGRHSFLIPNGGVIIDTPGIRELQLADESVRVEDEFSDIEDLALQCKFTNCRHENEKGCAVRTALEDQTISHDRFKSYKKLKEELASHASRRQKGRS